MRQQFHLGISYPLPEVHGPRYYYLEGAEMKNDYRARQTEIAPVAVGTLATSSIP